MRRTPFQAAPNPARPMIAFPAAVLAVVLCGAVSALGPKPRPAGPSVDVQPRAERADVARVEMSAAR